MPESTSLLRPPALRGDDPLGFLASVGLVALAEHFPEVLGPLRLAWQGVRSPRAVVQTPCESLGELADRLDRAFAQTVAGAGVLPGADEGFPKRKTGTKGGDPMRMDAAAARRLREAALEAWCRQDPWPARWLAALQAPAADDSAKGFRHLTGFYAPAGQMTLRGILDDAAKQTKRVGGPRDALTAWRRRRGYQGGNLDERAVRTAEVATDGKAFTYGAPSPTWLAFLAVRMLPVTDDGRNPRTTGWAPIRLYPGYTRRSLIWPIWSPPLNASAVRTLLAAGAVHQRAAADRAELEARLRAKRQTLRGLGVQAVFGASRRTADQADGPIGPAVLLWADG